MRSNRLIDGKKLLDQYWRLNNLYEIVDERGQAVRFSFKEVQELLWLARHYWNIILKSRQHGITTLIDLFLLDSCLFKPNTHAGILAHDLKSAQKIFHNKVKYPYDHLPEQLRGAVRATKDDGMEMRWANGSQLWVGTSMRSQTLKMLHVSEHGKLCAKYPKKAEELRTGTLPTLHEGSWLFIESTAEGGAGDFHDWAVQAQAETAQADAEGRKLNSQQMRFHFFPWYRNPSSETEPLGITVSDELKRYFREIEPKVGGLTSEQKAWYALKKDGPGGAGKLMKREYPSTPEEAFEQSVEGAIYAEELEKCRNDGRIGFYPWKESAPVYTFWDLGYADATVALFVQFIDEQVRVIECYDMVGRGAAYHAAQVLGKDYVYGDHFAPHDIMNHEKGTGIVLKDMYANLGVRFKAVDRPRLKSDGIYACRDIFPQLHINERLCGNLVRALAFYRYEWDDDAGKYKKDPYHDWASDFCDALQTLALQYRLGVIGGERIGTTSPTYASAIYADNEPTYNPMSYARSRR